MMDDESDVLTFLLCPALLVENKENVVHWVQFFCTVPVEHRGLLSHLHSNSLRGAHPCRELSMNRQQGDGPNQLCGNQIRNDPRGKVAASLGYLLPKSCSTLQASGFPAPTKGASMGHGIPSGCTTRLTLLQWLVVWSWVSSLTSLSLFLHF